MTESDMIVFYIVVMLLSVVAHESGHYVMARYYRLSPCFKWYSGNPVVFHDKTTDNREKNIGLAGILAGFAPIFLVLNQSYQFSEVLPIFIVTGYVGSCMYDIALIRNLAAEN